MRFNGFMAVSHDSQAHSEEQPQDEELGAGKLPELAEGEELHLRELLTEQKFTQPPPHYNEASMIKTLEELDAIHHEWIDRFSKIPEPVENLIKLIHLRLLATSAKISLIRETSDNIRIYMPYNKAEWSIIASRLDRNITKYIKYTIAPKSCQDGNSILLFNNSVLSFKEVFNILSDLFYYINKISFEYINK